MSSLTKLMVGLNLPMIDGHFWVVRDGKIIDSEFPEYAMIRQIRNCSDEQVYLESNPIIQQVLIQKHIDVFDKFLNINTIEEIAKKLSEWLEDEPSIFRHCFFNSLMEIAKNGGRLVFGSMGWKVNNSTEVFYEYGGENYRVVDFIPRERQKSF